MMMICRNSLISSSVEIGTGSLMPNHRGLGLDSSPENSPAEYKVTGGQLMECLRGCIVVVMVTLALALAFVQFYCRLLYTE